METFQGFPSHWNLREMAQSTWRESRWGLTIPASYTQCRRVCPDDFGPEEHSLARSPAMGYKSPLCPCMLGHDIRSLAHSPAMGYKSPLCPFVSCLERCRMLGPDARDVGQFHLHERSTFQIIT